MAILILTLAALLNGMALPILSGNRVVPSVSADSLNESAAERDASPSLAQPDNATHARVSAAYGKLPMSFERNAGQFDARAQFVSRGDGYTLFLTPDEAVMALRSPAGVEPHDDLHKLAKPQTSSTLRMKLVGANPTSPVESLEALPGKSNYFIGNDPKQWRTNVSQYAKVRYTGVYRSIDVVYYGDQGTLESDFNVAAGASPAAIRLAFTGAERIRIDANGELVLSMAGGEIRQHRPVAYQEVNGRRQAVAARYVMKGTQEVGFAIGCYDARKPLVIDPVLIYSTYLGGISNDEGRGIAVDSLGNAYVTGVTNSIDFPVVEGGFQTAPLGFSRVFVTKLNPSGSALVYSTYIGGSGGQEGEGLAVDTVGNVYITGITGSTDFPTTPGSFQPMLVGLVNAFVTKLNPSGSALNYSTYLGGKDDRATSIAIDAQGNAYVTGASFEGHFPVTPGAFQTVFRGGRDAITEWGDAFITKLNPAGTDLIYSTYLGGDKGEYGFSIAVDGIGNAYVAGVTGSTSFPTTAGAFQTMFASVGCPPISSFACEDGFVTKLNPTGTALVYSTYLGGNGPDAAQGIALDTFGNAFVVGSTVSTNFPTKNPIQSGFGGYRDAFVSKLNSTGSALVYSTYLGGSDDDEALGVAVDSSAVAYVTGKTQSTNFPTAHPLQPARAGFYDAFVAKLNSSGSALAFSSYWGGSSFENELEGGIAVDNLGNIYITGTTRSANFPTSPDAFQTIFGNPDPLGTSLSDAFVVKFSDPNSVMICLQDEHNGNLLQFNPVTGEYQFTDCRKGLTLSGIGVVSVRACKIDLRASGSGHSLTATANSCTHVGTASVQSTSPKKTYTLNDPDITNNTCGCR
jgi:hypothetical protein